MVPTGGRTYFEVPGRQRTHPSQELIAANTELLLRRGDYITPRTYITRIYQLRGDSSVARRVSVGFWVKTVLEPRLRGGRERVNGIVFFHRIRVYIKLCFSMKLIHQTTAFCRPASQL